MALASPVAAGAPGELKAEAVAGVGHLEPLVEAAPGHGEGHNSGMSVMVAAALAVKDIMEQEDIPGTLIMSKYDSYLEQLGVPYPPTGG